MFQILICWSIWFIKLLLFNNQLNCLVYRIEKYNRWMDGFQKNLNPNFLFETYQTGPNLWKISSNEIKILFTDVYFLFFALKSLKQAVVFRFGAKFQSNCGYVDVSVCVYVKLSTIHISLSFIIIALTKAIANNSRIWNNNRINEWNSRTFCLDLYLFQNHHSFSFHSFIQVWRTIQRWKKKESKI